ncbi:hypothetical protein A6283_06735 [Bacillus wiedmannii]|uniref:DUF2029 domain-containing protein n=3 Tax=Bacillus cereus group TaxID=86661 RepID=A0A1D3P8D2_9BACI|nr:MULTISPECIES: glycosyltransferase family 87 protein [Bacillus]EJQ41176.1 hypothetical protein IEI_05415 [Bacillus wiedmannii]KAA0776896.1 DUF2029 domain-containing protein [Bacillus sp. BB51/4]KMP27145.1 hypothetical protein TU50_16005 [Bacillus wiedmannii]KXY01206.1 hypothetical protein AT260_02330 [Bacillus wiedmannii]MCT6914776.1 DUF2029 domain-containing protein [Bacillus wiedmannii]
MVNIKISEKMFKVISLICLLGAIGYSLGYQVLWLLYKEPAMLGWMFDDFHFFYYAFHTIWNDNAISMMYDLDHQMETFRQLYGETKGALGYYMYPPQFAVFLSWFAAFPYEKARLLWTMFNSILFILGVCFVIQAAYKGRAKGVKYLLFSAAIIIYPVFADFYWGQSNRLIFFLVCLTYYFYQSKHKWLAGIPIVFATSFKLLPGIFLVYFLYKKEWKVFLSAVITTIITSGITIAIVGWNVAWEYVTNDLFVVNGINEMHGGAPWDSSFKGVLKTYFPHDSMSITHLVYVVILLAITFLVIRKCKKDSSLEFVLVTALMLLFSPVVEVHYLVLMIIVIVCVLSHIFNNSLIEEFVDGNIMYNISLDAKSVWHLVVTAVSINILMDSPEGMSYFIAMLFLFYVLLGRYYIQNKK